MSTLNFIKKYVTIKYKKISLSIIVFCRNKILSKIIVGVDWKWIILKPLSSAMHNTGCNRRVFTWLGICIVTLLQKLLIRQCVYCLAVCAEWLNVEYVVHSDVFICKSEVCRLQFIYIFC